MSLDIKANLRLVEESKIVVETCLDQEFCHNLREMGFLDVNGNLHPIEAAYHLAKGRIALEGRTGWEEAFKLIERFNIRLSLFLTYYDLRKKGRRVKLGFKEDTLIVDLGSKRYMIIVLEEGKLMTLEELSELSGEAIASGYRPVVAIVDRHGIITYYEAMVVYELQ